MIIECDFILARMEKDERTLATPSDRVATGDAMASFDSITNGSVMLSSSLSGKSGRVLDFESDTRDVSMPSRSSEAKRSPRLLSTKRSSWTTQSVSVPLSRPWT